MIRNFDELYKKVAQCSKKKLSVANAQDSFVLEAVKIARERDMVDVIMTGDADQIKAIASDIGMDLSGYEIIDIKDPMEAALAAVKLVHDTDADIYMKGLLDTKSFLKSILDKEVGLRSGKPLSHVSVFDIKGRDKLMFLTDVAFMTYPTLEDKVSLINNSVRIANACGVQMPKVAVLAAVEVVNEKMPVTVEGAELSRMNDAGEITGCIVDGPLSADLAIYPEAAKHKGATDRKIVGDADIVVFPDIHAGNITYKFLVHTADSQNGNVLAGTTAPAILTSRSDSTESKVNSIAIAAMVAEARK